MGLTNWALAAAAIMAPVTGIQAYVKLNPNGANVPGVAAIGHVNPGGGPPNNQYGLDFGANNHQWNAALCIKDSDGDGQTNGLELGDPCCVWSSGGAAPSVSTDISHPGLASMTTGRSCSSYTCDPVTVNGVQYDPCSGNSTAPPSPSPSPSPDDGNQPDDALVPGLAGGGAALALAAIAGIACLRKRKGPGAEDKDALYAPLEVTPEQIA